MHKTANFKYTLQYTHAYTDAHFSSLLGQDSCPHLGQLHEANPS